MRHERLSSHVKACQCCSLHARCTLHAARCTQGPTCCLGSTARVLRQRVRPRSPTLPPPPRQRSSSVAGRPLCRARPGARLQPWSTQQSSRFHQAWSLGRPCRCRWPTAAAWWYRCAQQSGQLSLHAVTRALCSLSCILTDPLLPAPLRWLLHHGRSPAVPPQVSNFVLPRACLSQAPVRRRVPKLLQRGCQLVTGRLLLLCRVRYATNVSSHLCSLCHRLQGRRCILLVSTRSAPVSHCT
jgi:hypothetical protein